MRFTTLIVSMICLGSCQSGYDDICRRKFDQTIELEAIVFLSDAGHSAFVDKDKCPYVIAASEIQHEELKNAWRDSSYTSFVRPAKFFIKGKVHEEAEDEVPSFELQELKQIHGKLSQEEVERSAIDRFGGTNILD